MDGKRTAEEERQSYAEGYEREAAAQRRRLSELEALGLGEGDPAWENAKGALEGALNALKQYGGKDAAEKRPAARKKETR